MAGEGAGVVSCAQTAGADSAVAALKAPNDFRNVRRVLQPQIATQPWVRAVASTGSQRMCGSLPGSEQRRENPLTNAGGQRADCLSFSATRGAK